MTRRETPTTFSWLRNPIPVALIVVFFVLFVGGCGDDTQPAPCAGEGESLPTTPQDGQCCDGLDRIPPKDEIVGIQGICTAKCGNQICDEKTESIKNCPADCNK